MLIRLIKHDGRDLYINPDNIVAAEQVPQERYDQPTLVMIYVCNMQNGFQIKGTLVDLMDAINPPAPHAPPWPPIDPTDSVHNDTKWTPPSRR